MSLIKGSVRAENLLSQLAQRYLGCGIVSKKKSSARKKIQCIFMKKKKGKFCGRHLHLSWV